MSAGDIEMSVLPIDDPGLQERCLRGIVGVCGRTRLGGEAGQIPCLANRGASESGDIPPLIVGVRRLLL